MLSEPGGGRRANLQRDMEILVLGFLLTGAKPEGLSRGLLGRAAKPCARKTHR